MYDLVVIGAGIHGAGVAQAAAVKGLSVCVIERREAAAMETSRSSSKLIHGGLRYLETAQFKLVYECLREQRLLLRNAAHLVERKPFYIPVYRHNQRRAWWVFAGLNVYRLLSGWHKQDAIRQLSLDESCELGLRREGLLTVFRYFDAQTDDQALTRAVLASAQAYEAEVRFECELVSAEIKSANQIQVTLSDGTQVQCKALVNAGGPWANDIAQRSQAPLHDVDWVQGTHIILSRPSPVGCLYVEAPQDKRAVFILPWKGMTMVGTTERKLNSPKASPSEEEIEYLLNIYNHYFPHLPQQKTDIQEVFSGIRVLPSDHKNPNHRSRETVLVTNNQRNYVGIYGGKLTSYRATADKVMQQLKSIVKEAPNPTATTDKVRLPNGVNNGL